MNIVLLILSLPFAVFGLYLIAEHFYWLITGRVVVGEIVEFSKDKNLALSLPIVRFDMEDDEVITLQAQQIRRWSYIFAPPKEEGALVPVVVRTVDSDHIARIYGFVGLVAGGLLCVPLLAVLAYMYGDALAQMQFMYALTFSVILFGGWTFLKFIQRS